MDQATWDRLAFAPDRIVVETTAFGRTARQSFATEAAAADYERRVKVNGGRTARVDA